MKAYKGFDKDLKCRDFQYEIGKEYEEKNAELCKIGFHVCEHPLDVFKYYPPSNSRFCEVELENVSDEKGSDTKRCGKKIKIGAELQIAGLIKASFKYTRERCNNDENGGDYSALNGGHCSALNGGHCSALNGREYSALNGGHCSALNGGHCSALNGGDYSALNGGHCSALNGENYSALNGREYSALNGGDFSVMRGGVESKFKGGLWSVFACEERKRNGIPRGVITVVVDGKTIKPNVWYKVEKGEFVEVNNDRT